MNKEVNFETSKLLKEKGFESESKAHYDGSGELSYYSHSNNIMQRFRYAAPTIAEVVMWLYEKHGIWIYPRQSSARLGFRCFIQRLRILGETDIQNDEVYESPTEAYEAAIEYTLKNLI